MSPASAGGKSAAALWGKRLARLRGELGWTQEQLSAESGYGVRQVRRTEAGEQVVSAEARGAMVEALIRDIRDSWRGAARLAGPSVPEDPGTSDKAWAALREAQGIADANREALEKLEQAARRLAEAEALLRELPPPPPPPRRRRALWPLIAALAVAALAAWIWSNLGEHRLLEGEEGSGDGRVMMRGAASGEGTVWLHADEVRRLELALLAPASCSFRVRYSNDNSGPSETVTLYFDGRAVGNFRALDTGDNGHGWNVFRTSPRVATVTTGAGPHTIGIKPSGGDGYGIEIDAVDVELER